MVASVGVAPLPSTLQAFPRTVGVIGGGTAGYFAALALRRAFPDLPVTLVESSSIPIIGVGEATTTLMPPFLHHQLGLDVVDLFRTVKPTFKLGIKFLWGPPGDGYFTYPFSHAKPTKRVTKLAVETGVMARVRGFDDASPVDAYVFDGHLQSQSLISLLMSDNRGPVVRGPDGELLSLLPSLKFAYHLENEAFVGYLARNAALSGVEHVDAKIDDVRVDDAGVVGLRTSDGRELVFDLYVDASGFRSLLLESALGSPFDSFASSLFCDRAIVATVPQDGPLEPCTTAETMDAGWCWRIPVWGEDHRGYVYASSFLSDAAAADEMRRKNPDMGEPRVVRFRSGRHRDFWLGNTVAVGNAYGFVEPLESTALHMAILEVAYMVEGLRALREGRGAPDFPAVASRRVREHWDHLRWFLAVHYRFNRRLDTPFWLAARGDCDVSGLSELLDRFRRSGPWLESESSRFSVGDPLFGYSGLMMLLLGQRAEGSEHAKPSMDRATWDALSARHRGVAARALPQREALEALLAAPDMLRRFVESPSSWLHAERFQPSR